MNKINYLIYWLQKHVLKILLFLLIIIIVVHKDDTNWLSNNQIKYIYSDKNSSHFISGKWEIISNKNNNFESGTVWHVKLKEDKKTKVYNNTKIIINPVIEYIDVVTTFDINNIIFTYKNWIIDKINSIKDLDIISYMKLLFLNIKDNNIRDDIGELRKRGIIYLFVISGFHISVIRKIITYILRLLFVREDVANIIVIISIYFFYVLTDFSIPVFRSFTSLLLVNLKYSRLKTFITSLLITLIFYWDNLNFLSFIFTYVFYAINIYIKNKNFGVFKTNIIFWISQLVVLTTFTGIFNIGSFFNYLIFDDLFSFLFFPTILIDFISLNFGFDFIFETLTINIIDIFLFILKMTNTFFSFEITVVNKVQMLIAYLFIAATYFILKQRNNKELINLLNILIFRI